MPVDASIPLGFKQPQFASPFEMYGQTANLKQLQANTQLKNLQLQQGLQTLRDQQELARIGAVPGNVDPATGMLNEAALTQITNPLVRQKLAAARMEALKNKAELDWKMSETAKTAEKRKSEALHQVMEEAYSRYEDVRNRTGNDQAARAEFDKTLLGGYEMLKSTGKGGFTKDAQFRMLSPEEVGAKLITHKEREAEEDKKRQAERAGETPVIKETRYVEKLKGQLADTTPGSPQAQSLQKQIADVEAHIKRLDRAVGPTDKPLTELAKLNDDLANNRITKVQFDEAVVKFTPRDRLQADALSAYRARYPYGYMPEMYGKGQPTPEVYIEEYIKNKGAPSAIKAEKKPTVSTKAEFDKLPKGTIFIDARDGKEKVKG